MNDPTRDVDVRYARGELTREEWLAQRQGTAVPTPPPQPAAPTRRGRQVRPEHLILVVILAAAVVLALAFVWSAGRTPGTFPVPSYSAVTELRAQDLDAVNASATIGVAYAGNDSLWFGPGPVTLVVHLSPAAADMAFEIQGLANPSIHVASGSRLTVIAVNMDGDVYHNWALTSEAPPYGSMPMMGGGMMGGGTTMMAMTMLAPASSSGFWSQQIGFSAAAGTFWYLCTVYGHAAGGMYGQFAVV